VTERRRKELAEDDFEIIDQDPYWLYNLTGRVNTDDLEELVNELREDATLLETAKEKIENEDWLPSEARLFLAERLNRGDYRANSTIDEIREEASEEGGDQ
jgi:hypothetical protein